MRKKEKEEKFDVEDHPRPFLSIQTPTASPKRKKFTKKLSFKNAQLKREFACVQYENLKDILVKKRKMNKSFVLVYIGST